MTAAQSLVAALLAHGGRRGFCVPGESYLAVLDALYAVRDRFDLITCRHEAGAANMAEAHGKLTGQPGLAFVTRGPGATHASIAVHTAFQDSTPMILFVGQVATDQAHREAFQEVDFEAFFSPLAKWAAQIDRADRVAEYVARAFAVATQGRPGPVVLALPEDMLTAPAPAPHLTAFEPVRPAPDPQAMARLAERLSQAERPMVLLGGSGWTAPSLERLAGWLSDHALPAATAFRCQDLLANDHPCFAGDLGLAAGPKLLQRLDEADLILAIGPRLGEITSGGYRRLDPAQPQDRLVHVHRGAEELGRVYRPGLKIQADYALFVDALPAHPVPPGRAVWCEGARADYLAYSQPIAQPLGINLSALWAWLANHLPADAIVANGAGNYAGWLHRFYRYRGFRTQLAPTSGAMGYGVPAALAAKREHPERTVVCAAGDGCFLMSAQELATAVQYNLAVIFLVFDNQGYGTIRMHQEKHYPGRVSATQLQNPDFKALAESFGCAGFAADDLPGFQAAFRDAQAAGRPALIHVQTDPRVLSPSMTLDPS